MLMERVAQVQLRAKMVSPFIVSNERDELSKKIKTKTALLTNLRRSRGGSRKASWISSRQSPLVGLELNLKRDPDVGRKIDLEDETT